MSLSQCLSAKIRPLAVAKTQKNQAAARASRRTGASSSSPRVVPSTLPRRIALHVGSSITNSHSPAATAHPRVCPLGKLNVDAFGKGRARWKNGLRKASTRGAARTQLANDAATRRTTSSLRSRDRIPSSSSSSLPPVVVVRQTADETHSRRSAASGRGSETRCAKTSSLISSGVVASTRSWTFASMSAGKTRPPDAWSAARMENSASAASATDGRPMSSVAGASEVEEGETAVVVASGPRNGRGDERCSGIRASSLSSVSPRRSSMISQRTAARRGILLLTRGPTHLGRARQRHDILVYSDLLRLGNFTAAARRATRSPLARARVRVLPPL